MATYELTRSAAERRDAVGDLKVNAGDKTFILAGMLTEEAETAIVRGDFVAFLTAQLPDGDWEKMKKAEPDLADPFVRNQLVGAYFKHIGMPSPFDKNGVLKKELQKQVFKAMGESEASDS